MSSIVPNNLNQDIETLNSYLEKKWSFKSNQHVKKQIRLKDLNRIIPVINRCIQALKTHLLSSEDQTLVEKTFKQLISKSEICLNDLALLSLLNESTDDTKAIAKKMRRLESLLVLNPNKQNERRDTLKQKYTLQFSDNNTLTISEPVMRFLKKTSPVFTDAFEHTKIKSKNAPLLPMTKDSFLNALTIFYRGLTPADLENGNAFSYYVESFQTFTDFFLPSKDKIDGILKRLVDSLKIEEHKHQIKTLLDKALDLFEPREDFPKANMALDDLTVQWFLNSSKHKLSEKAASRVEIVDLKISERQPSSFIHKRFHLKSKTSSICKKIARFKNLQTLNFENYNILKNRHLAHLSSLLNLRTLNLSNSQELTDIGLYNITTLQNLNTLSLSNCSDLMTDKVLEYVGQLHNLQILDLSWFNLTEVGIAEIDQLQNLHTLILSWNDLSDQVLNRIANLSQIRSLDLTGCNLTDANVALLADHPNLESLNLTDNDQLTDLCLDHPEKFKKLQSVNLTGCKNISKEDLTQLKNQKPELKIILIDEV